MITHRATGVVESPLRLVGCAVPEFSTLSRRRKTLAVTIPYRGSQGRRDHRRPRCPCARASLPTDGRHALTAAAQDRQAVNAIDRGCHRPERGPSRIETSRSRDPAKMERRPPPKPHRAETKMHCVKLLGQSLMARDFDRQVAELQVRAAVLNGYTALGITITEPAG